MRQKAFASALSVSAVVAYVTCAGSFGCLAFEPITDAPPSTDVGPGQDGSASARGALVDQEACLACMKQEGSAGCAEDYGRCTSTPKCEPLFVCGIPRGCYEPGTDLVMCFGPCGQELGLTSVTDPAVLMFIKSYQCALQKCQDECGPP